nr:hypothetical protein CFP56_32793 [Quercus suber]
MEISEYHNGARRGCLRVPEGTKIGGWTLFGRRLRDYFLGKSNAGPVEKVVAGGGEFEKAGDMQNPQVWKKLNGRENKGSNLRFVKYLPNITGQRNQFESLGGFDDVSKKVRSASVSTAGDGSDDLQISEWVTGEGLGTHEDEEGEIPSSGEGLGGSPVADMNSDEGPTHKEESREFQSSDARLSGPFVTDMKPDEHVSSSEDHDTDVEAGSEPSEGGGLDLYFPISEVGHGLDDSEVPRLIWDATLLSGKGEEAVNPDVITPLVLWDPNGSFDLVSMEDGSDGVSVEEVMEPSEWVWAVWQQGVAE